MRGRQRSLPFARFSALVEALDVALWEKEIWALPALPAIATKLFSGLTLPHSIQHAHTQACRAAAKATRQHAAAIFPRAVDRPRDGAHDPTAVDRSLVTTATAPLHGCCVLCRRSRAAPPTVRSSTFSDAQNLRATVSSSARHDRPRCSDTGQDGRRDVCHRPQRARQ
eukprot:360877-Chlamydomonas_euryale.AAC.1